MFCTVHHLYSKSNSLEKQADSIVGLWVRFAKILVTAIWKRFGEGLS